MNSDCECNELIALIEDRKKEKKITMVQATSLT